MLDMFTRRSTRSFAWAASIALALGGTTAVVASNSSGADASVGVTHKLATSARNTGSGYEGSARMNFTCNDATGVISIKLTNVSPVLYDDQGSEPSYQLWNTGLNGRPHVTVAITNPSTFDQATFELFLGQDTNPAGNGLFGNSISAAQKKTVADEYQGYVNGPWSSICQTGSEVALADFTATLILTSTLT